MTTSLPASVAARNGAPFSSPSAGCSFVAEGDDPPVFIASNATPRAVWHLARVRERRRGDAFALVLVADCSGLPLGGAHGYSKADVLPQGAVLCPRCRATLRREGGRR